MTPAAALKLGRVSNLPTVWSNVLAGAVLAAGAVDVLVAFWLMAGLSLLYVAGMYLNDAFDHRIDAIERPERPIPSGQASLPTVFAAGFGLLAVGLGLLAWVGQTTIGGWKVTASGAALAVAVLVYDWHHKNNAWSPVVMAVCRVLVYVTAGFAVAAVLPVRLVAGAAALFCYLIGLTYAARFEAAGAVGRPWPLLLLAVPLAYGIGASLDNPLGLAVHIFFIAWVLRSVLILQTGGTHVSSGVAALIAGISLLDASMIASAGETSLAILAIGCFLATIALQRRVPAT